MTITSQPKGQFARLLRFISREKVSVEETAKPGRLLLRSVNGGAISVDRADIRRAIACKLVEAHKDRLAVSAAGKAHLRGRGGDETCTSQHRCEVAVTITDDVGSAEVVTNAAESPLAMLTKRKDAAGRPLIDDDLFRAGERLRGDFTLGSMMPSIGVRWDAVGSGTRTNGVAHITDAAMGARERVERALEAVGPELAGVLLDVCCFLKGLETVERERQWPARSAKLILKTALSALDRHYHPPAPMRAGQKIVHWGSDDYRPRL